MRNTIIAISTALLLSTTAHAQILGGGGLGGTLGGAGSIGGTLGGSIGGAGGIGGTLDSVRSGTSGTLNSTGRAASSTAGSQSVDRKNGKVHADRSISANGGGDVTQSLTSPISSLASSASGSGSATGSGSADAQLIGTDAVRSTAQSARGTATSAVQSTRDRASGAASNMAQRAGSASGSAQGQGQGLISGASGLLGGSLTGSGGASGSGSGSASGPLTGSAAGSGAADGAFTVTRGMPVLSPGGEQIGKVRQVVSNARGEAQQILVKVDGQLATLPAANFSASGNAVTSAMGEGQIKKIGTQQENAGEQ